MTLIVETGLIITNANSYVDVAYADAYFLARANLAWGNVTNKEARLIQGQDYLYNVYHNLWAGYRYNANQALDWPRIWVPIDDLSGGFGPYPNYIDVNVIPEQLKKVQCEIALKIETNGGDLLSDLTQQVLSEQVGTIKITYAPNAPQFTVYRLLNLMIAAYLENPNSANAQLVR